ncbi:hypothetical protein [Enhygromyxa salina]|uniref:Lipoprotein n=1 Tax=Enhygromyxa salina TaxID=215803 RepID=A0A2S9XTV4_9BACT|nr:hypothetical protein [Enhygromyxa salina]PRP96141.1 hypothetical protein ENSA7_69550 [Enhygromyxa salina]
MQHTITRLAILAAIASLSACVYSPVTGDHLDPDVPLGFHGYASAAGATVNIEAFNQSSETWEQIGSTMASSTAVELGGKSLYGWSTSVSVNELADWECYVDSDCSIDAEGTYEMRVRFEEEGGSLKRMFTFDHESLACTLEALNSQGKPLVESAWDCRTAAYDQITLSYAVVW